MPGPGGGSRGGGGGRSGGFSSGGFSGGGFGGGHHGGFGRGPGGFGRGPRRPYGYGHFGWHHRPYGYGYGYGGGCLGGLIGGLIGTFFAPVILIIIAAVFILAQFGSAFGIAVDGGQIFYDENTFQDYANEQYGAEFGTKAAYEDNLLIVFAIDDVEYYDYSYIAWCGDHIDDRINMMFGAENTEFGRAISSYVNLNSYKYSLDKNLAQVMTQMKDQIVEMELESSFTCQEDQGEFRSHLTNKTDMQLSADTVDAALQSFTAETGISVVIVVDTIENIFGRTFTSSTIFTLLVAGVLIIVAVVLIVKAVKGSKNPPKQNTNRYSSGNNANGSADQSQSTGSSGTYW